MEAYGVIRAKTHHMRSTILIFLAKITSPVLHLKRKFLKFSLAGTTKNPVKFEPNLLEKYDFFLW